MKLNIKPINFSKMKKVVSKILIFLFFYITISATAIGGFLLLYNNGYIKLQSNNNDPAFLIKNVNINNDNVATDSLSFQEIAQKVIPSVVCIQSFQSNTIFKQASSEGSGIIMSSDGYIITNAHVIADAKTLKVILYNGSTYDAVVVGSDSVTDLALIKIEAKDLIAAEFGNSDQIKVADTVMAIGNPGGIEFNSSVTKGIVSAINRPVEIEESGYSMNCIQTDAAINPGNSGGALVNAYGQVIGINSSKIVATGYEGLGFAISINEVQPIITNLKQYGFVKDRAIIGITYQYIDQSTANYYHLKQGIYVQEVITDNAKNAGLKSGDIITVVDDVTITSTTDLLNAILGKKPGDKIKLTVYRADDKKTHDFMVTLSENTNKQ